MSNKSAGGVAGEVELAGGLAPKLRFPDFRNAGNWQEFSLEDVLLAVSREVPKPKSNYTGLGLRSHGKGTFLKFEQQPAKNAMDRLYIVHQNDLVVNITFAWEGAIAIANDCDHGSHVSHRFPTYEFKSDISSPGFFKYVITDQAFVYRLGVISPGGAGRNRVLNKSDFLRLSTLLPSILEQQKIAECLSSLDAVVSAEGDRLAALKNYKKGLLQQLFPADDQTTPRLRFPEFQNAGEWEELPIGSLIQGSPTYGVNARSVPYDDELPTYLRITDISEEGRYIAETQVSVNTKPTPENLMLHGDIALARTGASVGKSYLHNESNGSLVFAGFLIRLRVDKRRVLPQILSQFLQTQTYWTWVSITSARSGQPGINSAEYASLPIRLPKSGLGDELTEQQKIADCLSSLDVSIAAQASTIETLKLHKKSLLQQLFPAPAESDA